MKLIITDLKDFSISIEGSYQIIRPEGAIHTCIGCFGCWVKTPGECVLCDEYSRTGVKLSICDELILVSECCYGSFSPFVKTVLDRAISYVHPDFVIRKGEMHHKRRYDNVISLSAYFYGEAVTDREKDTAGRLLEAMADNYDGRARSVSFYKNPKEMEGMTL